MSESKQPSDAKLVGWVHAYIAAQPESLQAVSTAEKLDTIATRLSEQAEELERYRTCDVWVESPDGHPGWIRGFDAVELLDGLRDDNARLRDEKNGAYSERNKFVAALSKLSTSFLARTDIEGWEADWEWCVFVELPTGQASWHIHDSELPQFDHLTRLEGTNHWDGHSTEEKYERLAALAPRTEPASAED